MNATEDSTIRDLVVDLLADELAVAGLLPGEVDDQLDLLLAGIVDGRESPTSLPPPMV